MTRLLPLSAIKSLPLVSSPTPQVPFKPRRNSVAVGVHEPVPVEVHFTTLPQPGSAA